MRLRKFLFTGPAQRQLAQILFDSETGFGRDARARYEALVIQALNDLLDAPGRLGVRLVNGRIHYHLRHSRLGVAAETGRVGNPRHLIIARVVGEDLLVLAVAHDGMVDELVTRIEEGEGSS